MMSQSQYSLSWEAHVRNVCDGLSSLQQNGEFVDMTLAADGHMVKVHQVVLALASPYFKELIVSAQCPHPVIFLSKITESTLSALLEYIYTGEVLVSLEHLNDLVEAAKELHIKGLKDMKVHSSLAETSRQLSNDPSEEIRQSQDQDLCTYQVSQVEEYDYRDEKQQQIHGTDSMMQYEDNDQLEHSISHDNQGEQLIHSVQDIEIIQDPYSELADENQQESAIELQTMEMQAGNGYEDIVDEEITAADGHLSLDPRKNKLVATCSALQYTVSNQGSLQMILNRFVYYLKHTNRDQSRQWRCVDYLSHRAKCPALVFTKDDMVVQRVAAHTHPFHDKKIFKKLKNGVVFSAFTEAEKEGDMKKKKTIDVTIIDSETKEITEGGVE